MWSLEFYYDPINSLHFRMKCCRKYTTQGDGVRKVSRKQQNKQIIRLTSPILFYLVLNRNGASLICFLISFFFWCYFDQLSEVEHLRTVSRLSWVILCTQSHFLWASTNSISQNIERERERDKMCNGTFAPWKYRTSTLVTNQTLITSDTQTNR